jgi:hypothetical protein
MATRFVHTLSGVTHLVAAAGGVQMVMLVRRKREYFTDFIAREAKARGLKVVVNGSFVDLSFGSRVAVRWSSDPRDPSESTPTGEVIQEGKLLAGASSTGKFNFAQDTCGLDKFSAGMGNPSGAACAAIGGIAPIVIADVPYGAENRYKAGVPPGAPFTGDVDAKYMPFLEQKSNAMFAAILGRGKDVGKTAVGFSDSSQSLLVLSQENGTSGLDANGVRTLFVGAKMSNAVFLDCSDSATLYYDGKFEISPGAIKNEYLTVAVGFK